MSDNEKENKQTNLTVPILVINNHFDSVEELTCAVNFDQIVVLQDTTLYCQMKVLFVS